MSLVSYIMSNVDVYIGGFTALMIYAIGAYTSEGLGLQIVLKDLYTDGMLLYVYVPIINNL